MSETVRLSEQAIIGIRQVVRDVLGDQAHAWLFGSRTNPALKGGDIDLYVEAPEEKAHLSEKIKLMVKLEKLLGTRKMDVLLQVNGSQTEIARIAKQSGVQLI